MSSHGRITKIADFLFLVRPPLLCASCTFFFAGALSALRTADSEYSLSLMPAVLPNLLLFVLVVSAAFVVNQIFDVRSDAINKKSFILPSGVVSICECVVFLAVICVVAGVLSLGSPTITRRMVWLGLLLGFAYSSPPVRLKGKPVLDLLANVTGFSVIGFAFGWLAFAPAGLALVVRAVPYALAMSGIFLNTCIPDEEGDRAVGDRTSCVTFGREATSRVALIFVCGSVITGALTGETLCWLAAVGSLPAMIAVAASPDSDSSVIASQYAARLLLVLVCVRAPLLAGISVAALIVSKVYYRKRFGLSYPRLTGAEETARSSR